MIAVDDKLMDSWMALLDGHISVPVYKEGSVPETETGNYVELRWESNSSDDTKQSFRSDEIIITDIVTSMQIATDRSVSAVIDNQIKALINSTPGIHNLSAQSGMQIVHVLMETSTGFEEVSSGKKYYRKIVRYRNRIVQTT